MLPGKKYTPEDFLAIAWRRKWVVVAPFVIVAASTVAVSSRLPNLYRSEAKMVVVPQRVPDSYVRSVVATGPPQRVADRVMALRQQVTSRARLEAIIFEFNLYPEMRLRRPMEDAVERMRSDIGVEVSQGDAVTISYTTGDPKTAQKVTERLAGQFNEAYLRDRTGLAEETTEFLKSQLDDARRRLSAQDQKLADYKQMHAGELPSEREGTLQVLSSTQLQAQNLEESMNRDRDRRLFLERQIVDLEKEPVPVAPAPPVAPGADEISGASAAAQLEAARSQLRALELKAKPDHPDVKRLQRQIRDLEAKVEIEKAQQPSGVTEAPTTPEESARRSRIRDARAEIASLDIQLKTKENERQRLRDQAASCERRLGAMPAREAELTSLTRDYETVKRNYESLLARQEDSKMSADLERRQIGEQFRMVDTPRVPERPFTPNRKMIDLVGACLGLAIGIALAGFLEYRDSSLRSDDDVVATLSLPVLAVVPRILTVAEARRLRRQQVAATAAACVLLAVAAALGWRLGILGMLRGLL